MEMGICRYIIAYTELSCIDFNVRAGDTDPYALRTLVPVSLLWIHETFFNNKHCYIKLTLGEALLRYKGVKAYGSGMKQLYGAKKLFMEFYCCQRDARDSLRWRSREEILLYLDNVYELG